jgi:hypothetical protein
MTSLCVPVKQLDADILASLGENRLQPFTRSSSILDESSLWLGSTCEDICLFFALRKIRMRGPSSQWDDCDPFCG